jgi:multiple sugar transport system permease protein
MKRREFFLFTGPSMVMMFGLMIVPLFFTLYLSLTRYSYGEMPVFIGLENYINIVQNRRFWNSVQFTLILMAATIPIELLIGFSMALILDHVNRFRGAVISTALIPNIVTPVVGTLVFAWLFQDQWGFYSWLLSLVGVTVNWFATAWSSRLLLIIHSVWQSTPFVFLVLYAGLQAMSRDQLESAQIDGASYWQRVRHIIIPSLMPLFVFIIMIRLMDAYRIFDSVFVMTRGGPGSATETVMFYNYEIAFAQLRLGAGSAVSVLTILGILILLIPSLYRTFKQQTAK